MMHAWSLPVMSHSATPWTTRAFQAPLSMGFSRQEYWTGLPCPPPGDPPEPGIEPESLTVSGPGKQVLHHLWPPGKPINYDTSGQKNPTQLGNLAWNNFQDILLSGEIKPRYVRVYMLPYLYVRTRGK